MSDINAALPPIVICSTKGECLPVLAASIEAYVPSSVEIFWSCVKPIEIRDTKHCWHLGTNDAISFGDSYNNAVWWALSHGHRSVILANDDIVLRADSYSLLMEDVAILHEPSRGFRPGLVGARSDNTGHLAQNIRFRRDNDQWFDVKWESEFRVWGTWCIAPLFAWISAEAFYRCPFPPITAASDNVQCWDLMELGYQHFISRSYVHHVGGITTKNWIDDAGNVRFRQDYEWIAKNRPKLWETLPNMLVDEVTKFMERGDS
jgi:hypothetical protein